MSGSLRTGPGGGVVGVGCPASDAPPARATRPQGRRKARFVAWSWEDIVRWWDRDEVPELQLHRVRPRAREQAAAVLLPPPQRRAEGLREDLRLRGRSAADRD